MKTVVAFTQFNLLLHLVHIWELKEPPSTKPSDGRKTCLNKEKKVTIEELMWLPKLLQFPRVSCYESLFIRSDHFS